MQKIGKDITIITFKKENNTYHIDEIKTIFKSFKYNNIEIINITDINIISDNEVNLFLENLAKSDIIIIDTNKWIAEKSDFTPLEEIVETCVDMKIPIFMTYSGNYTHNYNNILSKIGFYKIENSSYHISCKQNTFNIFREILSNDNKKSIENSSNPTNSHQEIDITTSIPPDPKNNYKNINMMLLLLKIKK